MDADQVVLSPGGFDRYRVTLRSIGEAVIATDPAGRVALMNPSAEAFTGWTEAEARGKPLAEICLLVDEGARPLSEEVVARVLREGTTIHLPGAASLIARDATRRAVVGTAAPIRTDEGALAGAVLLVRDESADRLTDQALRDSEALLRESQEVAGVGSYVLDVRKGQWSSSRMLDTIFGLAPAADRSVAGWVHLIHPDDRERMAAYFEREVIGNRQRFDREYRILRASDGAERWVHGVGRLEFDDAGAPVRMIGTIRDITAQKQHEFERARLQAQLLQAQKMESVGRLAGGVAHDFNNMLGAILGHTELALETTNLPASLREDLLDIQKVAQRSAELTRQLLGFARRQTIAPRPIDLNETIEGLLHMLRRLIGEDVELRFVPARRLWPVRMDPSQVVQILTNLCVNSRDAIDAVGRITVETSHATVDEAYCAAHAGASPGEYVRVAVSDDGHGMDRGTLSHLFEPFFTTKRPGEGTGLGLATVYGIVRQNEGFISVYSEPGVGTTFTLHIPRYRGEGVAAGQAIPAAEAVRGTGTILVVEDDSSMLRVAATTLVNLGYDVLVAGTPQEALRTSEHHDGAIDLVLTDVVMPSMHGRELVTRLRERRPDLPCVYMSGYTADVIANRGVLEEGVRFIQKPFSVAELSAVVQAALADEAR